MDFLESEAVKWLVEHYPQVAGYVLAIFLTGWVVWKVAGKLQKVSQIDASIQNLATKEGVEAIRVIVAKVEPSLQDVRERFVKVEERVETLWKDKYAPASSPRKLNDRGKSILETSGVKEIIDSLKDSLLAEVRKASPTTAYDAERIVLETVENIPKTNSDLLPKLKDGAFRTGADVDTVLLIGGIYLRDQIFSDLGFSLTEIDQKKD